VAVAAAVLAVAGIGLIGGSLSTGRLDGATPTASRDRAASADEGAPASELGRSRCDATPGGYRCLYGPVRVGYGSNEIFTTVAAPPDPGYIASARATVVDVKGRPLDHHLVHLHHSGWLNMARSGLVCDTLFEGIYGTGKERTAMRFPSGYGYYWSNEPPILGSLESPSWQLYAILQGMHRNVATDAYLRLDLGVVSRPDPIEEVKTLWLSATGCNNWTFSVPRGSGRRGEYRLTSDFEMPEAGRIVWAAGHVHDGGLEIRLENASGGSHLLSSKALYEDPTHPWSLTGTTVWSDHEGIAVARGDVLRLTAIYDSSRSWPDAMAALRLAYVPVP